MNSPERDPGSAALPGPKVMTPQPNDCNITQGSCADHPATQLAETGSIGVKTRVITRHQLCRQARHNQEKTSAGLLGTFHDDKGMLGNQKKLDQLFESEDKPNLVTEHHNTM